jgi:hypothetical protein
MKRQRRSISVVVLALLALAGGAAPAAEAGSLLSGYGTPGEGNQAILGSALLGGGGNGGGSSGSGRASGSTAATGTEARASSSVSAAGGGSGARPTTGHAKSGGKAPHSRATAPARTAPGSVLGLAPVASTGAQVSTPALGITGTDLVYILLGVGGLLLTGVFTRQLVRRPN